VIGLCGLARNTLSFAAEVLAVLWSMDRPTKYRCADCGWTTTDLAAISDHRGKEHAVGETAALLDEAESTAETFVALADADYVYDVSPVLAAHLTKAVTAQHK
jgi:hypothetical protein